MRTLKSDLRDDDGVWECIVLVERSQYYAVILYSKKDDVVEADVFEYTTTAHYNNEERDRNE